MSKRQRDEANIASIRAVLGDIPVETIENLLHRSNNNVEAAVNLYFSGPLPPPERTPTPTAKSKSVKKSSTGAKYYIGDFVVTGWSLIKGASNIKEGHIITIVRDKIGNSSNKIVRFAHNGREIGRVPREVANYISTLLDLQLCSFEGAMVWCPPIVKIGEDMIIMIKCYLLPGALHSNSFMSTTIPQVKRKAFEKAAQDPQTARKLALIQMFRNLGLRPVRSAIKKMKVGGENSWDMLLQSVTTKEETEDDSEDPDKKKEISDGQLDTIYEKAEMFDSQLEPMEQPFTMSLELKEYQKRALAWMSSKEVMEDDEDYDMRTMHPLWNEYSFPDECEGEYKFFYFNPYNGELSLEFPEANSQDKGGILADEMGLGKTIEILSLIHTNRFYKDSDTPPTPLSSNESIGESAKRTIRKSPTTLIVCPMSLLAQWRDEVLRGSKQGTISVEVFYGDERSKSTISKLSRWDGSSPDVLVTTYGSLLSEWTKTQSSNTFESPLFNIEFWRVVLDEAHQIKNKTSKTSQACRDVKSKRRWAVTGTPIQNKLDDLYSLVRFLKHEPWANHTFWRTFITLPFERQDPVALNAVQTVLGPIVLRRTKAMRDRKGQPIVPLPSKEINIEYLNFSREEQDIYDAIYNDSQIKFSYFCEAGKMGQNYASIFQLLTRLRQICCHPYLALKGKDNDEEVKAENGKAIRLEDLIANHITVKNDNSLADNSPSEGNGSYGLNVLQNMLALQSPDMSTSETTDSPIEESAIAGECPICFETPDTMIAMPCMHMACRPCIMDYFQKREDEGAAGECPVCRHNPILQSQLLEIVPQSSEDNNTSDSLKETASQKKSLKYDIRKAVGGFKPSSKIQALIKLLRRNLKEGCKTVVFSQFTSFLDLIGEALDYERLIYTRLDGTQAQSHREKVLANFARYEGGSANILLISLRAGGVGLNLTCANKIVMMDPWWNFSIEAQAIDRVHRLGQLKDVVVTRFIMRESIEERILEIQNRKHALVNELYQSSEDSKHKKFEDLQILFSKSRKY